MPKHPDFQKIYNRFIKTYGEEKGKERYYAWLNKKGYNDTKPFPGKSKEKKELLCKVRGVEIKETEDAYHVEGLIATTHIDDLATDPGIDIPDRILKETLESFATQINTTREARVMGVFHSEGRVKNAEFFGEADIEKTPAEVIPLSDGEWGLYVDTKLLKDDPMTPEIIERFEDQSRDDKLNSFSITYDTNGFMTTDFEWIGDDLVRVIKPETRLYGYTASNETRVANHNAIATGYGFKELKELVGKGDSKPNKEGGQMTKEHKEEEVDKPQDQPSDEKAEEKQPQPSAEQPAQGGSEKESDAENEQKEFKKFLREKKEREQKELMEQVATKAVQGALEKMEAKEKVLKDQAAKEEKEVKLPFEVKEFVDVVNNKELEIKEQFRRAAQFAEHKEIAWDSLTTRVEEREFKNFGVNGRHLEFKGLGVTTNQNTDTDYLQSAAELQDVYDPVIYNGLNQETVTWNLLAKDDYSKKGNNQVQFTLKTAANASAAFYTGNAVTTDNVTRLKYQTKFKKLQVGVSVDGDMIAAARGGPVSDVFAQEVMDSTMDMLAVLNAALFGEKGAETDAECLGFEYITDSAGNTTLYSLTRSTTNLLSPASATDTYINQSSTIISMGNLRSAKRQAIVEGANKRNLVFITHPTQADLLRGKFDDSRRMLTAKNTDFGFSTDLFVDGIPVFEDKDCNTDDWWLVDLETHRVGIWVPPTIERLGKTADSEDAFIKMYFATYNRAPRRMVQIYGCATS